jgi:hypothetical protein
MRKTQIIAVAAAVSGGLLVLASLASVGQTADPFQDQKSIEIQEVQAKTDAKQADLDKQQADIDKQLADLEAQRAKLDAQIRELRHKNARSSSRAFVFRNDDGSQRVVRPNVPGDRVFNFNSNGQQLTPEQRAEVDKAMAEARRALEDAQKAMPKNFVIPNLPDMSRNFQLFSPDGGQNMSPEDRAKFEAQMRQFGEEMKKWGEQFRSANPGADSRMPFVYRSNTPDGGSGGISPEVRRELQALREELRQLRDELRQQRGRSAPARPGNQDQLDKEESNNSDKI